MSEPQERAEVPSPGDGTAGSATAVRGEPLPIWFFVGLLLLVYGFLVLVGGLIGPARGTVLAETRPWLWWGIVMSVFGALFLTLGLRRRS